MANILIVDDEKNIRNVIKEYAKFDGFETFEAEDGMQAVEMCRTQDFDLIIMDIMMPKLDGYSAVREIRKTKQIPVIMLSARGEEYDKLAGLEGGADDYVVKPFSPSEIIARVKAILARTNRHNKKDREVFNGLVVDFDGRAVQVDGVNVDMTPREYELIFYLVRKRGIAVSREELLREIWGEEFEGDDRTVDTHIKMLRSNLGPYRDCIVTIRGMGYKFDA